MLREICYGATVDENKSGESQSASQSESDVPWARAPEIDVSRVQTPCHVVDLGVLRENADLLARVQRESGAKVLAALKGYACWPTFSVLAERLSGVTASSIHEARLGREEFGGEVHSYAPAWSDADLEIALGYSDHLVLNSFAQVERYRERILGAGVAMGVRVNPEHSEVATAIYDPCAKGSRLGVTRAEFRPDQLDGVSGLHFHTLCECGADALERTVAAVEERFGEFISGAGSQIEWVNFGGGHHVTRPGYDVALLVRVIEKFRARWGVAVYIEPGEAIALNAGVLVASVLDIVHNDLPIAILDTSASAHMPDTIEMPYRPEILGAGRPGATDHTYRLGGMTCLAGDIIGDYSFPQPLERGDKLVFLDMAHYTMVKATTFNGVRLPSIALHEPQTGTIEVVREFGYEDFRGRLG